MRAPLVTPILVCVALVTPRLWAAEPEPNAKTTAYQTSVSQEQLRNNARRLKEEMAALLNEFSEYRSAAAELARLKDTTDQLDNSSQAEMLAVVKTLREASRTESSEAARGKIVVASTEQKNIQALLRKLADQLILQRDAAAMQQRVKALALRQATNLQTTKELEASGAKPEKVPFELKNRQAIARAEQEALRDEVKMAVETLQKLAQNPEAAKNETFKDALATAEKQGLQEKAKEAAEKTASNFAEATQAAKAVSEGLQNVLQELQKNQSAAEKSSALAQELKDLAQREDRMAKTSPHAWSGNQEAMRKEQKQISAQLEVAQKAVEQLNPEAGAQTAQASQKSDELADSLKKGGKLDKVENLAKATDAQRDLAKQLNAAGEMLQKQADELAGNSPAGNSSEGAPQSPAEAAIGEAVKQVMDAKSQMALANRQLGAGETDAGKQRLEDAQGALQKAEAKAAEAGAAVDKSVGEQLKQAEANAAKAEQGAGQGTKAEEQRSRWGIDRAQENASKALDGLKAAANQLAAQASAEAGKTAGNQPGKPGAPKDGASPGKPGDSRDSKGGANASGTTAAEATDFSALAKLRSGQREALSLLKTEKTPAEYEAMVQQYLRNLAEADSAAP